MAHLQTQQDLRKHVFIKSGGKEATTLLGISVDTTGTWCKLHFLEVSCDCPLPNSGALSPGTHLSLAPREAVSGTNL